MDVSAEGSDSRSEGDFGSEDEEFYSNLFQFWDFPLEDVSTDGFVGDWDDSSLEHPGPMAVDVMMSPAIQRPKVDTCLTDAHVDESHKPKQLPDYVGIASKSCILDRNPSAETQSGAFQTQSPDPVVKSSSSCFTGIFGAIPGQPRSRTIRRRPRLRPWNLISFWHSAKPSSGRTTSYQKNKERKILSGKTIYPLQSSDAAKQLHSVATEKCTHCEITKTPQWREGPLGPKTLCNACGVRYRSGRLFPEYRPAASPTFVPELHSNSQRKVLAMRYTATQHARKVDASQMLAVGI